MPKYTFYRRASIYSHYSSSLYLKIDCTDSIDVPLLKLLDTDDIDQVKLEQVPDWLKYTSTTRYIY